MGGVDKLTKQSGICAEKNRENRRLKEEIRPPHSPRHYTARAHANRIVKMYVINDILEFLRREEMI